MGAGALANYSGAALTDQLPVTASMESMTATTVSPLTEATLNGGVVTLTLTGGRYASSIFDVRRGVTVSGIAGVSVGTFGITRVSDTKVTVELTFNGDIDADGTLTFTVGAGAIANYSGPALTDQVSVTALEETVVATTPQSLTEATLNGSVVTLTLTGRSYASSIFDVRRAVTVSGITGVSVGSFGIQRASDTKVTVTLTYNGDIDADGTLTFTVGAGAISNYSGAALTAQLPVSAGMESVTATTVSPLTEATLNGGVVTLTLSGGAYASSIFDVRRGVTVSGIAGVSVGTFGITRASDTKVTVELTYNGDIDADGTLTFTVGAGAIASYSGAALTAQLPVRAGMESVTASTTSPLTEATLNGGVVTLTLTGGAYASSIFDVRRGVSVSGIAGVSVGTFGITRVSDTKVTVELTFNGDIDADGTLTFTVGAGAIANYNGDPLLATLPVTAESGGGTNQVPTFTEGASATRSFAENTGAGQNIGNPVSAADSDGGTLTYSLEGTDASSFTIVSSSGQLQTRTGVTYDFEVKNRYQATVRVSDGQGGSVTIGVRINLTDVGEPQANPVLYWTDAGRDKIQRANLDGSNVEDLVDSADGLDGPVGITLDVTGGKMYWTEWKKDKIRRANLDGSNVENLITSGLHTPVWMALDVPGGKIYWTDWGTDRIQRANLDGSNVEDLVTRGLNSPGGLALDVANGKMYWTDSFWHKIQRANLDGSNVEDLITSGLGGPSGLALDVANGKMYWTELNRNRIQRANLDGSNIEDLVTRGLGKPNELVLDLAGGKMYWTNRDFSKIQRANLDGSNIEDLVTSADGLSDPTALALAVAGQVPTFNEGASATRSFAENAGAGQNIGNPVSATDSDGGTLTYSLEGTDAASFVLVPTSGQLQTRAGITYDFEVKNRYEVTVRVSDGQSGSTTIDVTINLTDVSEPQARPELYWTDLGTHKIQRADLDGSNVEDLVTRGLGTPVGLAVDVSAGKMYWPDMRTKKIQRSDLDGSNVEDLVTSGLNTPVWMALDVSGGKMYWTDWGTDRIQRANLDGSNVENLVVAGGLNSPAGLVLDVSAGKMYWTDSSADKIQRADLDGSNVEDLITSGFGSPSGLALDIASGKMYWTDRETGEIQRADLDGSNIEDVITRGLDKPIELDLDLSAGKMYWTDLDTDKIQRANLDGSSVEDLVTRADGLDNPFGLALATPTVPTPPAPLGRCATGSAVQNPAANPWLVSDCNALLDARDTLVGTATLNWSENTLISTWDGVTLSGTPQRVTKLRLWNESLNGTIPAELSRLTGLKALYLAFNQLTGTIPAELGTMTSLTHLGLMNNRLTGRIPAELRNLTNLGQFALQHNQLTGTIPTWLGDLPRLKILNLEGNRLTGTIPAELGRLAELWQLLLFGNQLTGPIPAELGNLSLLQEVRLDDNKLTGSIPSAFSNLTRLTLLYLAGNTLTGCVPVVLRDVAINDLDKLDLPDCTGSQGQVTADFNDDGIVNFADFFDFVDAFGTTDAKFDLDGSGTVDFADFFEFVDAFGTSG